MKHICSKILVLLLLCIVPSISNGEMSEGITIENGRITGTVSALFGKGMEYETAHDLLVDCSLPIDSYTPDIFEMEYRFFGKKEIQQALQAIGQSNQGTFRNSPEQTSYVNTTRIDPSASISKEAAAQQAVEIGIRYFDALGIEVDPTPVYVERPYDRDAYMAYNQEIYSHRFSDTTAFMQRAAAQWKRRSKYETRTAEYTLVKFAVMVDGIRIWTQPSYPAGYKDEPDARIGFEVSASVLVSDSGVLVEAATSHIPQIKKTMKLNEGESEHCLALRYSAYLQPLIRAESWNMALELALQDASKDGMLFANEEDQSFQNQDMDQPITKYGCQTVITDIYPCLSTISKDEWAMFWHIDCQQQYADGWRY